MWKKKNIRSGRTIIVSHEEVRAAAQRGAVRDAEKGVWFGMITPEEIADQLIHDAIAGSPLQIGSFEYSRQ